VELLDSWCGAKLLARFTWSAAVILLSLVPELEAHINGDRLGGTALSNPMKAMTGIEPMLLKAEPTRTAMS
jgi:hypothetical protein